MKRIALVLASIALLMTTGCIGVQSPVLGLLVIDEVKHSGMAKGKLGPKEGKSCAKSYLALFATGDASIEAAAEDGGITNVMSIERESRWIILFGEYCTIVRGT